MLFYAAHRLKTQFEIFYKFISISISAIQAFELISAENYYLSKFPFKKHINFSHMSFQKSLMRMPTFYGLFAYEKGKVATGNVTWIIPMKFKPLRN